jgi:hypothetical protein
MAPPITHTPNDGPLDVTCGLVRDPDYGPRVLLQLPAPMSYVLTDAANARKLAAALLDAADELDSLA